MLSTLQQALALVRGWADANELLCVGFAQTGELVKGDRAALDQVSAVALARYCELVGNKRALTSREAMQLMGGRPFKRLGSVSKVDSIVDLNSTGYWLRRREET